jgi:hypothetical protein
MTKSMVFAPLGRHSYQTIDHLLCLDHHWQIKKGFIKLASSLADKKQFKNAIMDKG